VSGDLYRKVNCSKNRKEFLPVPQKIILAFILEKSAAQILNFKEKHTHDSHIRSRHCFRYRPLRTSGEEHQHSSHPDVQPLQFPLELSSGVVLYMHNSVNLKACRR
jgi:hypothetical protein